MTSKLDVLSAVATRLYVARDSGKIKGSGDDLSNIIVDDEHKKRFDILIYMQKRATLIIHVIRIDTAPQLTSQKMVNFMWQHKDDAPTKPSYNAGDAPLSATFTYSKDTEPLALYSAAQYLIEGWLNDTNPSHMWTKFGEENND